MIVVHQIILWNLQTPGKSCKRFCLNDIQPLETELWCVRTVSYSHSCKAKSVYVCYLSDKTRDNLVIKTTSTVATSFWLYGCVLE